MEHVFISYVHENIEQVKKLDKALRKRGIKTWLDRDKIKPGTLWKDAIQEAIQDGIIFIACFSVEYWKRSRTHMNEELEVAIDELRLRPKNQAWFIPILLNECEVPDIATGSGKTLKSIQYVPIYKDWKDGLQRILSVIKPETEEIFKDRAGVGKEIEHEKPNGPNDNVGTIESKKEWEKTWKNLFNAIFLLAAIMTIIYYIRTMPPSQIKIKVTSPKEGETVQCDPNYKNDECIIKVKGKIFGAINSRNTIRVESKLFGVREGWWPSDAWVPSKEATNGSIMSKIFGSDWSVGSVMVGEANDFNKEYSLRVVINDENPDTIEPNVNPSYNPILVFPEINVMRGQETSRPLAKGPHRSRDKILRY